MNSNLNLSNKNLQPRSFFQSFFPQRIALYGQKDIFYVYQNYCRENFVHELQTGIAFIINDGEFLFFTSTANLTEEKIAIHYDILDHLVGHFFTEAYQHHRIALNGIVIQTGELSKKMKAKFQQHNQVDVAYKFDHNYVVHDFFFQIFYRG